MPQTISPEAFDKAYEQAILGRTFVEYEDYYNNSKTRFRKSMDYVAELPLPSGSKAIDIGGGIMAVLCQKLLDFDASVFDVTDEAEKDIRSLGLGFGTADLYRDIVPDTAEADLVIITEVIEHIPKPPYLVFDVLAKLLKPGGYLFLTTPNGHRFRNLIYMIFGKEILDPYRYPDEGQALGHQHEYTKQQLVWQTEMSTLRLVKADYYEDSFSGASTGARLGRVIAKPAGIVPYWRNSLAMVLQKPPAGGS